MPSGWLRLVLEQFEFPYEVVYPPQLDAGQLRSKYDVLILPDGAIPEAGAGAFAVSRAASGNIPEEYRARIGAYSSATTLPPQLRAFLEAGGTVLTIGSSTALGQHLGLPIGNKLVDGKGAPLAAEQFYVPGSVLRVKVDTTQPLAQGLRADTDVYFDNSPVFTLPADAVRRESRRSRGSIRRRRCAAGGRGARHSCRMASPSRRRRSGRAVSSCSARRSRSGRSLTARSSSFSTASTFPRRGRDRSLSGPSPDPDGRWTTGGRDAREMQELRRLRPSLQLTERELRVTSTRTVDHATRPALAVLGLPVLLTADCRPNHPTPGSRWSMRSVRLPAIPCGPRCVRRSLRICTRSR